MSDIYAYNQVSKPGFGNQVSSGRRSLINPGDRKKPTDYYSYAYTSSETPIQQKLEEFVGARWVIIDNTSYLSGLYGAGILNAPFPPSYIFPPAGAGEYENTRQRALARLFNKVKDAKSSDFNAAVFGAEASKSFSMITNAATRTFLAMRKLKRGDLVGMYQALGVQPGYSSLKKSRNGPPHRGIINERLPKGKHVADNASNYWCEAWYGWVPLLSDAKSAAEKLASTVLNEPTILSVKGRARSSKSSSSSQMIGTRLASQLVREELKVQYLLNYTVSSQTLVLASSLGLTNPMLLVHELTPLSFVLDWFLPIGDFLENLSAFHGLEFSSGALSSTYERDARHGIFGESTILEYGFRPDGYGPTRIRTRSAGSYRVKQFGFVRSKLSGFPAPSFPKLRVPEGPSALKKAVTALALLKQRV